MVTAPGSGAEVIPFLKTWVNLPMAIGFTVLYAQVHALTDLRLSILSNTSLLCMLAHAVLIDTS